MVWGGDESSAQMSSAAPGDWSGVVRVVEEWGDELGDILSEMMWVGKRRVDGGTWSFCKKKERTREVALRTRRLPIF